MADCTPFNSLYGASTHQKQPPATVAISIEVDDDEEEVVEDVEDEVEKEDEIVELRTNAQSLTLLDLCKERKRSIQSITKKIFIRVLSFFPFIFFFY